MTVAHRATVPQSLHPCRVTRRRDVASHCLRCIGNGVNIHEDLIGAGPIVAATSGERCEANGEQRLGGTRRRRRGSLRRAAGREQIDSQSDDVMPSSVPSSLSKGRDGASASVPEAQEEERAEVSAALALLRFYKSTISPLLPPSCRFLPTCSEYAMESYKTYGFARGTVLTAWRLLRCNPLNFKSKWYDPPQWPPPGLEFLGGGKEGPPEA